MPTSTKPYEVLFDVRNDTPEVATLQLMRGGNASNTGGATLESGGGISLVLDAGSIYHYLLRFSQHGGAAKISVKAWNDVQCTVTEILDKMPVFANECPTCAWALDHDYKVTRISCDN